MSDVNQPPIRYIEVLNVDTTIIPAGGAMRVVSIDTSGRYNVMRPNADGQTDIVFNDATEIPPIDTYNSGEGQGIIGFPCVAAYQTDDTGVDPNDGEIWGTKANSWYLHRSRPGFRVFSAGYGLCNVFQMSAALISFVRITSTTMVNGLYPAVVQTYDPIANAWMDGSQCWYKDANS